MGTVDAPHLRSSAGDGVHVSLETVICEVEKKLALYVECITFGRGYRDLQLTSSPPRVVWVPAPGGTKPVTRPGGTPRQLLIRSLGLQAYCFGKSWTDSEDLSSKVMAALTVACMGTISWGADQWPLENEQLADWLTRGQLAVVTCTIDVPVLELGNPTVSIATKIKIQSVSPTSGDGVLQPGET